MGAGCSNEKATATDKGPPLERTVSGAPGKKEELQASEPPPARIRISSQPGLPIAAPEEEETPPAELKRDPEARREALKRCFDALDKDKSGSIDFRELKQYLFKTGVNVSHITGKAEELMKKMDLNDDELVSVDEFVSMMEALLADKDDEDLEVWVAEVVFTATSRNVVGFGNSLGEVLSNLDFKQEQVDLIKKLFSVLDRDKSKFVELDEIKALFGKSGMDMETASHDLMSIMSKLDKNGDSKVSEQEFFVTLAAVQKCLPSDQEFMDLLANVMNVAQAPERAESKPALTEVLLSGDV